MTTDTALLVAFGVLTIVVLVGCFILTICHVMDEDLEGY
jgi:uncharacterized membrane protein